MGLPWSTRNPPTIASRPQSSQSPELGQPDLPPPYEKGPIELSDSGPFFELLNVRDCHETGSRIWSTMPRFCSSLMPAE